MKYYRSTFILSALIATLASNLIVDKAMAFSGQDAVAVSSLCSQSFTRAERKYGIPKHLLMAIANTESGRYHKELQRVIPWPWTLNVAGEGAYYDTLHDAATAINRAKQSGKQSIDVGCMQVSLKHHPDAFVSVTDALNPASNVDYAARFLRSNYDELGSWPQAIAAYHSRTPRFGNQYYARVRERWKDVRMAAGGNMLEDTDYMMAGVKVSRLPVAVQSTRQSNIPTTFEITMRSDGENQRFSGDEPRQPRQPAAKANRDVSMKVIKVSARPQTSDGQVIKITPMSQSHTQLVDFVSKPRQQQQQASSMKIGATATPGGFKGLSVENPPAEAITTINKANKQSLPMNQSLAQIQAQPELPRKKEPYFIFGRE